MLALATSPPGRKICLAAFFLTASTIVGLWGWQPSWLQSGLPDLAHQTPLWVAVSIVIFLARNMQLM